VSKPDGDLGAPCLLGECSETASMFAAKLVSVAETGELGVPWPNLFGHAASFPVSTYMPTQAWAWHPTSRTRNKLSPRPAWARRPFFANHANARDHLYRFVWVVVREPAEEVVDDLAVLDVGLVLDACDVGRVVEVVLLGDVLLAG